MIKPKFIKRVEKQTQEVFSSVSSDILVSKTKIESFDKNKNMTLVHVDACYEPDGIKYNSKLYKTSSGFYIYCKTHLGTGWDNFEISVYLKPENINEVIIFLKQLNKK